ncbi:methyltransferase [Aliidiomarina indica]|uniref:methyltransferase n=1 Tax=Aliidiomarina indica TaxID=2749147 RepID=UPI001890A709|nr:methyltransferase [Aliidiomarina indica]
MNINIPSSYGYERDSLSALDAISEAQRIAHAPMFFFVACLLRDKGILEAIESAGDKGINIEELSERINLSTYALSLLLDNGLSLKAIYYTEQRYHLGKVGHFLLHDPMTIVNMNFSRDVCYLGMQHLEEAFSTETPAGLKELIDSPTIYPVLSKLPSPAKESWFAYDHYYSDNAFSSVLPLVFASSPKKMFDVGGNTGKWARACVAYDPEVEVTIVDLPIQCSTAEQQNSGQPGADRIATFPIDILSEETLPSSADFWWMSQFLDCFSEEQITNILKKIHAASKPNARIGILELFWNCQKFEAAALSLNAASLYFTTMANGNSRFYSIEAMLQCLDNAGFEVESRTDHIGYGHTLLICRKK